MRSRPRWTVAACLLAGLVAGCAAFRSTGPEPMTARVVRISEEYANINTDLPGQRLRAAGIVVGSEFAARFDGQEVRVTLGEGYGDVPRGDWVGLIEEDGTLQLAVSFGHAADVLGCEVGDVLTILPAVDR